MDMIHYYSTLHDIDLTIDDNRSIVVINTFGDRYTGRLEENGKVIAKSAIGLSYIMSAMEEYRNN